MKLALANADPVALNVERTWLAVAVLFAVLIARPILGERVRGSQWLGVLPLSLLPLVMDLPATRWSVTQVLLLVHVGVISTALGFLLWIEVLRFLPAGTASLNMFAIPVIALLASMAIFGERLGSAEWAGIACIGIGLVIVTARAWRAARYGERAPPEPTPLEGG